MVSMQVQNLVLEVLLANLMISQSVRVMVCYAFVHVMMFCFNYAVDKQWFLETFMHHASGFYIFFLCIRRFVLESWEI